MWFCYLYVCIFALVHHIYNMDFKSKLITSSVTLSNSESIPRLKGKCDRSIKLPVLRLWKKHVLISNLESSSMIFIVNWIPPYVPFCIFVLVWKYSFLIFLSQPYQYIRPFYISFIQLHSVYSSFPLMDISLCFVFLFRYTSFNLWEFAFVLLLVSGNSALTRDI